MKGTHSDSIKDRHRSMTRYLPRELISTHLKSFSPRDKCSLLEYPKPCSEYWWLSQEFMKGGQACARVQTTAHIIGQSLKDGCHISNLRHPVCQSEVRNTDYKRAQVIYRVNPYSQNCRLFRHSTMWGPWKAWFTRKRGSWELLQDLGEEGRELSSPASLGLH